MYTLFSSTLNFFICLSILCFVKQNLLGRLSLDLILGQGVVFGGGFTYSKINGDGKESKMSPKLMNYVEKKKFMLVTKIIMIRYCFIPMIIIFPGNLSICTHTCLIKTESF